jgi:hypothetical protein
MGFLLVVEYTIDVERVSESLPRCGAGVQSITLRIEDPNRSAVAGR